MQGYTLLSGSSNRPLALNVARLLKKELGRVELEEFPNKEIRVRVNENVKGKRVFILQSTSHPTERHIFELALIADAAKRKGAGVITAILPWFGYSPQDKVFREGEPLSATVVVKMLESAPINEFVLMDIHSNEVLLKFSKKVHHLSAMPVFIEHFNSNLKGDWCSVSLDNGAHKRATEFAEALKIPLVEFDKSRNRNTGRVTFHKLKGDVHGKNVISFDDFVSTGGTRIKGSEFLKKEGARKYYDCVTHLLVPKTINKLARSKIDRIFITDSIELDKKWKTPRIKIVSIAPLIAGFIRTH